MTATRMDGVTAIVSNASVNRVPISVVIALSACGRFSVITATRPSATCSTRTEWSGSMPPVGGGPKSSASHRSVPVELVMSFPCRCVGASCVELREPTQRLQTRCEAILSAASDDERGQLGQPASNWLLWNRECARPVIGSDHWILLGRGTDEDAVIEPLRLDELELPVQMRSGEDEDDASILPVVVEHAFRQHRAVTRPPADHPVEPRIDTALMIQGVAWIGAARV